MSLAHAPLHDKGALYKSSSIQPPFSRKPQRRYTGFPISDAQSRTFLTPLARASSSSLTRRHKAMPLPLCLGVVYMLVT